MEPLCPECMGPLSVDESGTARCSIHGGTYRILFLKERVPLAAPPVLADAVAGAPVAGPAHFQGMTCVQHPTVPATAKCQLCGAYMCPTCDFVLPGDAHFCPSCATNPQPTLSPKRRRARAWAFALAGWSTLGMVAIFTGAFARAAGDRETAGLIGTLMLFGILVPSIVGMSLAIGARDRRWPNPMSLTAAIIWNAVIVGIFFLLMIIGMSR